MKRKRALTCVFVGKVGAQGVYVQGTLDFALDFIFDFVHLVHVDCGLVV